MTERNDSMPIDRYLRRIGIEGGPNLSVDFLDRLQRTHIRHVPFEALDIIPLRRPFSLEPEAMYAKIVTNRRGGFCFELNGLLAVMLERIGFGVDRKAAHFIDDPDGVGDLFDHMPLLVTVPGDGSQWLVDVAAGRQTSDGIVPLDAVSDDGRYRTGFDGELWHYEMRNPDGTWRPTIAWMPETYPLTQFEARSHVLQTDPESPFMPGAICTLMTDTGRVTLSKSTLIETKHGRRTEHEIRDLAGIRDVLSRRFGIDLELEQW